MSRAKKTKKSEVFAERARALKKMIDTGCTFVPPGAEEVARITRDLMFGPGESGVGKLLPVEAFLSPALAAELREGGARLERIPGTVCGGIDINLLARSINAAKVLWRPDDEGYSPKEVALTATKFYEDLLNLGLGKSS